MNFADIEGRLDVAYRFANSLQAHFGRLITDPYTIHRWRSDWLRTVHLLEQDEAIVSPLGQRMIAARLLRCLDENLSHARKEMRASMTEDNELADSLRSLLALAITAPDIADLSVTTWLSKPPEREA